MPILATTRKQVLQHATWMWMIGRYWLVTRACDGAETLGWVQNDKRQWKWEAAGKEGVASSKYAAQRTVRKVLNDGQAGMEGSGAQSRGT